MGKTFSVALRPWKNYNIRDRAHKFLDADKSRAAPKHPSDRAWKEASKQEMDEIKKKDDRLLNNLKSVYVVSREELTLAVERLEERASSHRPLPRYRRIVAPPPYGYVEPERVSEGKVTLMQAITFIAEHKRKPEEFTAKAIASNHGLEEEMVEKILRHFKLFDHHEPEQDQEPTIAQRIAQLPKKLLTDSDKDKS